MGTSIYIELERIFAVYDCCATASGNLFFIKIKSLATLYPAWACIESAARIMSS
jgi:hypothetical protein